MRNELSSDREFASPFWRYRIFAVTWFAYAGFYLVRKNFSVVMPMLIDDLGFTKTDLAWILTGYSVIYMLGQFANGMLSDRFGPRLIVGFGLLIAVTSNVIMGFGASLTLFVVLMWINGYGQSTGWSGLVKNMATWYRHGERGIVMGWWCTCYVVGGFAATIIATYWATNETFFVELGWRRGFFVPALLLAAIAGIYIYFTRNRPSDAGFRDLPEDDEAADAPAAAKDKTSPKTEVLRAVLSSSAIWITGAMYFFVKMTRYAFLFWLPLYMTEALDFTNAEAGYTSSVYEMIGFLGVLIAGYASDKLFQSRRFPVGAIMLYGLAVVLFIHPSISDLGLMANAISIGIIGIMTYGPDALMSGAGAMDLGSQRGAATAAGVINGMGSCGQLLSPLLVAYVSDAFGWNSLFYLFVVFALISATLLTTKWNYGGRIDEAKLQSAAAGG